MLQNITVANFLAEKLNTAGEQKNMAFRILADAGFYEGGDMIHGVLAVLDSDGSPLENFTSRKYRYSLNFEVPDHKAGTKIKVFNEVVSNTVKTIQGKAFALDGGEAVFTLDIPCTNEVSRQNSIGLSVKTSFTVTVVYTVNAITTSKKVWLLDDVKIPYTDESIDLEVQGMTNNIYGLNATQSLPMGQTKFYRFTLPFDSASPICSNLQKDILSGDMNKVYTLKYYDGVSYTEDSPFTTTVSLFRTGNSGANRPSVSSFTIVFTDVDDGSTGAVLYEMALIDNPFDSGSVNVRYFANRSDQYDWYAEKIATGAQYSPIKAPNLNSLTITQQVYIKPKTATMDLNSLLTKNYAIIRATDKETKAVLYYYYYYIQSASVGANNQIMVSLNMDTIQTYYFDPNIKIPDCLIERAHLNRWVDNGDGTVCFDNSKTSPLIQNELGNCSKFLYQRTSIVMGIDTDTDSKFNLFLQTKKTNWVLIYLTYNAAVLSKLGSNFHSLKINNINTNLICLVAPIGESTGFKITINNGTKDESVSWNSKSLFDFINADGDEDKSLMAYVQNIKVTPNCPLSVMNHKNNYTYSNFNETITIKDHVWFGFNAIKKEDLSISPKFNEFALCVLSVQSPEPSFCDYTIPFDSKFLKSEIVNSTYQTIRNPKFLSPNINELKLVDFCGNSFSYDIQKISNNKIRILCTESLSCDITKTYYRIKDIPLSAYDNGCDSNLTGLVTSNDTSIPYSISQISSFLANNKNYALMQQSQRDYNQESTNIQNTLGAINSAVNIGSQFASGNIVGGISNLVGSSTNIMGNQLATNAQNNLSKKMQNMALDNMRAAPQSIANTQGNILFSSLIDSDSYLSIYIEIYCATKADIIKTMDSLTMFGFAYNYLDNIKNIENVHYYFNYIQAQIDNLIGVSMSNDARNDIRRRFSNGIRFWNSDEIRYDKENYEKWLSS